MTSINSLFKTFSYFIPRILITFFFLLSCNLQHSYAEEIICEGAYGGHLQGIAVDDGKAIFWSFTVDLVKTDMKGKLIKSVPVANHHGDLTCCNGKVYVAVNLGEFNLEPGKADSWVYVYDAKDLTFISKHKVPELVHGAGGMGYHDGAFIIIGGLPKGYKENYAYEYDDNFKFISRHVVNNGYTLKGIQTACYAHGFWWFGCYGFPDNKALFKTDATFTLRGAYDTDFSVGIDALPDGKLLRGITWDLGERKKWRGKAVIVDAGEFLK